MRLFIATFVSFLFTALLVQAACPLSRDALKPIAADLGQALAKAAMSKPGSDPKDVVFVLSNVLKAIFEQSPYSSSEVAGVTEDAQMLVKACYTPVADFSMKKVQDAFKNCATQQLPSLLLKYASPGLKACSVFENDIIPNWESRYKAMVSKYFPESSM